MFKYISVILLFISTVALAQTKSEDSAVEMPKDAETALKEYVKIREGYKRSSSKQFSKTEQYQMDDWCFAMEKAYPNDWQTAYVRYLNGHFYSNFDKLKEAYNKAPNDKRVIKSMFGYFIMMKDLGKQKEMLTKVSKYYTANELSYYTDALPSTGVLIVSSEAEAIPLRILQLAKGKGKDVKIVCMDHLINDEYRKSMAHDLGTGSAKFFGDEANFVKTALGSKKVYLSSTVSQSYISGMANNAYVTGLYYEGYVQDQKTELEGFWAKIALKNFSSMSLNAKEKRLYQNYLPPLMTLYKIECGAGGKDETLKKAILVIADKVGQTKTVTEILKEYDNG